jgi:hypothetical protein
MTNKHGPNLERSWEEGLNLAARLADAGKAVLTDVAAAGVGAEKPVGERPKPRPLKRRTADLVATEAIAEKPVGERPKPRPLKRRTADLVATEAVPDILEQRLEPRPLKRRKVYAVATGTMGKHPEREQPGPRPPKMQAADLVATETVIHAGSGADPKVESDIIAIPSPPAHQKCEPFLSIR